MNFSNIFRNIRILLFIIGLFLTIWRGFDCLHKYYHSNLSTSVHLIENSKTILPVIVICPDFSKAYIQEALNEFGISDRREYLQNLSGNSSGTSEWEIFKKVTYNSTELIKEVKVRFNGGKYMESFNIEELRYLGISCVFLVFEPHF